MKDKELSDKEMQQLAPYLPRMNRLDLSSNNGITPKGFYEVSKCVLNAGITNLLKELNVDDCDFSDDSIIAISQAIPYIEMLNLSSNNGITPKGFYEVSKCVLNAGITNLLKELKIGSL